jgi:hypothetical protein
LADFFTFAAAELERHGSDFDHEHFAFFAGVSSVRQSAADIIVFGQAANARARVVPTA